jgi:hypothetical protein
MKRVWKQRSETGRKGEGRGGGEGKDGGDGGREEKREE